MVETADFTGVQRAEHIRLCGALPCIIIPRCSVCAPGLAIIFPGFRTPLPCKGAAQNFLSPVTQAVLASCCALGCTNTLYQPRTSSRCCSLDLAFFSRFWEHVQLACPAFLRNSLTTWKCPLHGAQAWRKALGQQARMHAGPGLPCSALQSGAVPALHRALAWLDCCYAGAPFLAGSRSNMGSTTTPQQRSSRCCRPARLHLLIYIML